MLDRILEALVATRNEAADDLLLEAVTLGNESEKPAVLDALFRRARPHGLTGLVRLYDELPESARLIILGGIRIFHQALRECGRSDDADLRIKALRLIALGRQGRLGYVLLDNLASADEAVSRTAVEALVALARWCHIETRRLQGGGDVAAAAALLEQRPDIEQAVARAMDVHRGRHGADLLRAALLLCDSAASKTLAILHTAKHGGQGAIVRRLQQPPAAEHVEAFLLGASHGNLRSHFGVIFSHIVEAPVLDAMLRKTHWLKDHQLALCMHQVSRGTWWEPRDLAADLERRDGSQVGCIGEWIGASGLSESAQDQRLDVLRIHAADDFAARLRLLRVAMRRGRGTPVDLIRSFLGDRDERLVRLAAREIVRRRPHEYEKILIEMMTSAPESVRRVIGRALGQAGFEQFWQRFDRLEPATRKSAGRAMLKLLPDAVNRLARRLVGGPIEQRLKAMQMAQELSIIEPLRGHILALCSDANAKLRSKAVSIMGDLESVPSDVLLERVLGDSDPRVRANAIEVLESKQKSDYVPLLARRARSSHNRERANAIKALHGMKVGVANEQLLGMLRDERAEHRISALWALRQIGWWQLIQEVGRIAKVDGNLRVRRYALNVLRGVAEKVQVENERRRAG